jgi:hypothetical protein
MEAEVRLWMIALLFTAYAGVPSLLDISVYISADTSPTSYSMNVAAQNVARNSYVKFTFSESVEYTGTAGASLKIKAVGGQTVFYDSVALGPTVGATVTVNPLRTQDFFLEHVGYGVVMDKAFLKSVSSSQLMTADVDWAFGTGDHVNPVRLSTIPVNNWGAVTITSPSTALHFTFSETVSCSGVGTIQIRDMFARANPATETFACDSRCTTAGTVATVTTTFLQPCARYEVTYTSNCFVDVSQNANSADALTQEQFTFYTSCLSTFAPTNGQLEVDFTDSITVGFSEALLPGTGYFVLTPDEGSAAESYIIGAAGNELTFAVDYTSVTFAKSVTSTVAYLCPPSPNLNPIREHCKGITWTLTLDAAVLRRQTPVTYQFGGLSRTETDLPVQLGAGSGSSYTFTMRVDDNDFPQLTFANVHAIGETAVRVDVRLDEAGTVYCAPFVTSTSAVTDAMIGTSFSATTGALTSFGYYPASMDVTGLTHSTTYHIFCYTVDDEIPTPNVMSTLAIQATLSAVTTFFFLR